MPTIYSSMRLALLAILTFCQFSLFSQTVQIGSGTSTTGTSGPSPVNNYYRSQHIQIVYSKGELNAVGITAGNVEKLGFYIASSTSQAMPDYKISLGHTTARDAWPYLSDPVQQVYHNAAYSPTAGGFDMLRLDTAWYWNGVDNIIVDVCFDYGYQPNISTGTVRTYNDSNYRISYNRSTVVDLCGLVNPSSSTDKPQIQFEFTSPSVDDAGVSDISPDGQVCGGSQPVSATIINYGTNALTSATVNWSVNGIVQTPANFAGSLSAQGGTATVALGNYAFTEGAMYSILAWTSSPNGNADSNSDNDSLSAAVNAGLNGTYTIGGGGADYVSFTNAVLDLETYGVCGHVTFNVASGGYFEQVEINEIPGVGPNATVTFQSTSGDSTTVVLSHGSNNTAIYTLYLNGSSWVTFKNITIESTDNSYDRVVYIGDESHHISFENNIIRNAAAVTPYNYRNIEIESNANSDWLNFSNNRIVEGYEGIYNASQYTDHFTITGNTFYSQQYGGVLIYYADFVTVEDNKVITTDNSGINGILVYDADSSVSVQRNIVRGGLSGNGIAVQYCDGTSGNRFLIANNFVSMGRNTGTVEGIYLLGGRFTDVVYNTVNIGTPTTNHRAIRVNGYNDNRVYNNNASADGGYAYYVQSSSNVSASDNNNWYTGSSQLAYWSGTTVSDLAGLQAASGFEASSFAEPPYFVSDTSFKATQISLNNNAMPYAGLNTDIEGDVRDGTNPDIGCDEFTPGNDDAGILTVIPPATPFAPGSLPVYGVIKNFGNNTLTSADIDWEVNGVSQSTVNFAGSVASGDTMSVFLGNVSFASGTIYNVKAYTSSPNGNADGNALNDTAAVGPFTPALGGNYTIGGVSPDFADFTTAVEILNLGGTYDSATIDVRSGTYTERIVIGAYPQLNMTDHVTFRSEALDSSAVTLTEGYVSSSTNYVVALHGARGVSFEKLTIQNTSANSYSTAVEINYGSSYITFEECALKAGGTTSSATSAVDAQKNSGYPAQRHLSLLNCSLSGGYYGAFIYGNSTRESNIRIEGCHVSDFYGIGIYVYLADSAYVLGNTVVPRSSVTSSAYGAYLYDIHEGEFSGNQILGHNLRYGLDLDYLDGTMVNPFVVANNFITSGGSVSGGRGVYAIGCTYLKFVHNSVWCSNSQNTAIAFQDYTTSNTVDVLNNIFQNTGGGYAYDKNYTYGTQTIDYNNFYVTGTYLGMYGATSVSDLATWVSTSNHDSNSVSIDPQFVGMDDLHTNASGLNAAATPLTYVSTDIDGDGRDPVTPDIGADEFALAGSDAALVEFDAPKKPFAAGLQSVHVTLLNNGGDTLKSVTINWEVNGVAQTPFAWTGSLLSSQFEDSVNIGSFTFVEDTNYTLRAWVSNPNGNADILASNDTIIKSNLFAALAGTYTVGGVSPDFMDFSEATLALKQRGIAANVIFDVRDGVYNEELLIRPIAGVSSNDSVIFQSESGDSAAVVLQSGNTGTPTVRLRGIQWFTFKDMTIAHTYYWVGPNVMVVDSGASHLNILGCIIKDSLYQPNITVGDYLISAQSGYSMHDVRIMNTTFKNGRYGLYLPGANTSNRSTNTEIKNCVFDNQYYEAIYTRYNNNLWVVGNNIWSTRGYTAYDAIEIDQTIGSIGVTENQLRYVTRYGLALYNMDGSASDRALVANNYIHLSGNSSGAMGVYTYYSEYVDFAHNSINSFVNSTASRGFYCFANTNCNVVNNIFQHNGGGLAVEWYANTNTNWNFNDLYTTGTNIGEYQNAAYTDLAAWIAGTNLDSNSISLDAQFSDTTDYHIESASLDGAGTAFAAVTKDIDGEGRDPVTPDLGADEISLNTNDAALTAYLSPKKVFAPGNQTIYVDLLNNGSDSLTTVQINWSVNGTPQTPLNWTGGLATGQSEDSVAVGVYNFIPLTYHDVEVFTSSPNGQPDDLPVNDTVKQNNLFPGLSGAYTLGGVSPDFADFASAVQALHAGGVVGPVSINVRDGIYTEQVLINTVMGTTSSDSVVFQSENADASLVNLEFNGNSTNRYTVRLNGTSYLGFKNMTLTSLNSTYGYTAEITGSSMGLRFANCVFNNQASGNTYGMYSTNINQSDLHIMNCEFNNGNGGIYIQGNYGTGLVIANNSFNRQRTYGIFAYYFNEATITRNSAVGAPGYSSYSGMYMAYFRNGYEITKNRMHAPYGGHGMYLFDMDGTALMRGLVANNFAIVGDSTANASSYEALWFQYGDYVDIFNNSTHHASTVGEAVFVGNVSNVDVRNNIFAASNGGYAFYSNSSPANFDALDYNAYFGTGANLFYNSFGNINAVATLNAWQGVMGLDANSIVADPLFVSSVDLHVNQSALDSAAASVAEVTDDIDDELRDPTNPDIGADEISFLSGDIAVTVISGISSGCGLPDSVQITIALANNGTDPQTGFDMTLVVNGDTTVETFNPSIGSGANANHTFATYYDFSTIGAYSIKAWSSLAGDINAFNDTSNTTINNYPPPVVSVTNDTTVCGGSSVQLTASGGVNFFWSTGVTGPSITVAPNITTIYTVTVTDANGCMGVDSVTVNISSQVDSVFITGTTCDSTMADTVMNVYQNQGGCDSIVYTVLTYSPSYAVNVGDTTICDGETVNVFGNLVGMAGTYYDTLTAVGGCDSILSRTVFVNPTDTTTLPVKTICQGDSSLIFGTYQFQSGVFFSSQTNQFGCDSVLVCELVVNPVFNTAVGANICEGQSLFVGGALQTMAGVYYDTLQTVNGCDSILATNLNVWLIDSTTVSVVRLTGDSIFAGGAYQKTSGIYYDTYTGSNGCDSVHGIDVDFKSPARSLTYSGNPGFVNSIVSPLVGDAYTVFTFEVMFTDTNGILPPFGFPRVIMDFEGNGVFNNANDRTILMNEVDASDMDPSDGKLYTATINALPEGLNWETRVVVQEGGNTTVLGPQVSAPQVLAQPDLEIFANDISFSNPNPTVSSPLTVNATIHNASDYDAQNFVVHLVNQFDTTIVYPDIVVSNLPARSNTTVSWNIITPAVDAWCPMQVFVDYTDVITETNELDNTALRPFTNGNFNIPGSIKVIAKTSPSVMCSGPNKYVTVSGFAWYDDTAVPLTDSSVAGAQVDFTLGGATYQTVTNSLGNFSKTVPAPIAVGGYPVVGQVTDFTLTGNLHTSFTVQNCGCNLPDLTAQVAVSAGTIIQGQSITGTITVKNVGSSNAPASLLTVSQTGGTPTLNNQNTSALGPNATWTYAIPSTTFNTPGTYSICASADGDFMIAECSEGNTGCATIRVLPNLPDIVPVSGPIYSSYLCNSGNPGFTVTNTGGVPTGQFVCRVEVQRNGSPDGTFYHTITNIPAQQNVGFTIPYTYTVSGTYTFSIYCDTVVATGGEVTELSELNNVGVYTKSILECKPDLAVTSCRSLRVQPVDPVNPGVVTYELRIYNGGNATATGPIPVDFVVNPGSTISTSYNGNIAPGQTVIVTTNTSSVAPATASLTGIVDPLNAIPEFNENNNSYTDNLCWEFEPVPQCGYNFWNGTYLVNQTAYLSVGVDIDHLYEASSVDVQFEVSGPGIVGTQNLGIATLNNVYKNCGCPWVAILPTNFVFSQIGVYTFTMTVDPNNVYAECNEANNVLVKDVTVGNAPDMRILSQFINPSLLNPEVNDTVDIIVTYENIGHQNVNDQMELKLLYDNMPIDSISPVGGLVTGDNASFIFSNIWVSNIPGAHVIRAIIDSDDEIGELDELNNEATRALIVGDAANLYFQQLFVSNPVPALMDNITITAEVGNNGDVDASADVLFSYIDDVGDTISIGVMPVSVLHGDSTNVSINWVVADENTTIVAEIINTNTLEFLYTDNMTTTPIGGYSINIVSVDACYANQNGSLTATASGGTAPYTYTWNTGQSGVVLTGGVGTYSVTAVDANGVPVQASSAIGYAPGTYKVLSPVNVCQGDSILLFGEYRNVAGTYYDTIPGVGGCDTVCVVSLRYRPTHNIKIQPLSICEGDSALIFGSYRNMPGLYVDSLTNVYGCDSIRTQQLMVNPVDTTHLTATTTDPAQAGTFVAKLTSGGGCDSTVITVVTYVPGGCQSIDSVTVYEVSCDSTLAGIVAQTFTGSDGCDSVVTTITNYDPGSITALADKMVCSGDSVLVFGNYQHMSGMYFDTLSNFNGCDSILSCRLIVKPTYLDTAYTSICEGDSLMLAGAYQITSGYYTDSLSTMMGCDSVIVTSLMVMPTVTVSVSDSICPGSVIFLGGAYQTMAGVYYDTLNAANTCDSVVITTLTIRTDQGCGPAPMGDSLVIVTDANWMKSTVINLAEAGGYPWPGVSSLPATATYTLPAEIGQPYPWHSIDSVDGARVFKSGNGVTFFRTTFNLAVDSGVIAQIRTRMDDGMEIYINGQMLAREDDRLVENWNGVQHNLLLKPDGSIENGYGGDLSFDIVNNYRMDSLVTVGLNELVIALRNSPNTFDKGGFSFRMDIQTGVVAPKALSKFIVSDAEWMQSTVTTPGGSSWNWPGVNTLPAAGTYTLPVEIGQPYHWYSTEEVDSSFAIKAGSNITYYRRRFTLLDSVGINVRLRTTFDENIMVFVNDSLIVGQYQHGLANRALPGHDVVFPNGGLPINGNAGGDMFMQVENVDFDNIFRKGDNYITVALQNRANEPGGFSLRLDLDQAGASIIQKVERVNSSNSVVESQLEFNLYPNPTRGNVYVELVSAPSSDNEVLVFDLSGKLLGQQKYIDSHRGFMEINLKDYSDGIYIIRIRSGEKIYLGKRIMKF